MCVVTFKRCSSSNCNLLITSSTSDEISFSRKLFNSFIYYFYRIVDGEVGPQPIDYAHPVGTGTCLIVSQLCHLSHISIEILHTSYLFVSALQPDQPFLVCDAKLPHPRSPSSAISRKTNSAQMQLKAKQNSKLWETRMRNVGGGS